MDDVAHALGELAHELAQTVMRISELERRADNTIRHGKVTDVDTKKHLARIEIGEKEGMVVKSPWLPYAQMAGTGDNWKFHNPPVTGQQLTLFAPTGEHRQAVLLPFTWWDEAQSPSDKEDEHVITFGKFKMIFKKDSVTISVGSSVFEMTEDKISIHSETVSVSKKTYTGQDEKGGTMGPKVVTEVGSAKQHWAVV